MWFLLMAMAFMPIERITVSVQLLSQIIICTPFWAYNIKQCDAMRCFLPTFLPAEDNLVSVQIYRIGYYTTTLDEIDRLSITIKWIHIFYYCGTVHSVYAVDSMRLSESKIKHPLHTSTFQDFSSSSPLSLSISLLFSPSLSIFGSLSAYMRFVYLYESLSLAVVSAFLWRISFHLTPYTSCK